MALSTLRKNFYRISTLIIDHGADAMRSLLNHFIQKKYKVSFKDFVAQHQHSIYHNFNISICCLCQKSYQRPFQSVINGMQMKTLFDNNCPKLPCHKHSSKHDYCCSTVKPDLKLKDIDITLLRFFLVTYFEEEFWQNCLIGGVSFHDFLNEHKHDIFHLVQLNTPCCLCMKNPDYTLIVGAGKDKLTECQWNKLFSADRQHCEYHKTYVDKTNPCSVSATKGIDALSLDKRAQTIILSKFCQMLNHVDQIVNAKNAIISHAVTGELSDHHFQKNWDEIESSIIYLSKITSTHLEKSICIQELREKSLEESMCLETYCLIIRQMQADEHTSQELQKLQQSFKSMDASVAVKLQEIQSHWTTTKAKKDHHQQLDYLACLKSLSKWELGLVLLVLIIFIGYVSGVVFVISIGSIYIQECPAETNIPLFFIVAGSVFIMFVIIIRPTKENKQKSNTLVYIVACCLLAWWIAGNVWIYRIFGRFSTDDADKKDYCNENFYRAAFASIGGIDFGVAYYIIACITECCKGTKQTKKDDGPHKP